MSWLWCFGRWNNNLGGPSEMRKHTGNINDWRWLGWAQRGTDPLKSVRLNMKNRLDTNSCRIWNIYSTLWFSAICSWCASEHGKLAISNCFLKVVRKLGHIFAPEQSGGEFSLHNLSCTTVAPTFVRCEVHNHTIFASYTFIICWSHWKVPRETCWRKCNGTNGPETVVSGPLGRLFEVIIQVLQRRSFIFLTIVRLAKEWSHTKQWQRDNKSWKDGVRASLNELDISQELQQTLRGFLEYSVAADMSLASPASSFCLLNSALQVRIVSKS